MSRRKFKGKDISGVLLLNKDLGCSSNQALQQVKRVFGAAKAGHTGSLDPLATGVLPICFGEATKFAQFLLNADKSYRVEVMLGVTTRTGDSEGEIVRRRPLSSSINQALLEQIITDFTGAQSQVPSIFSAIKHQGKPLYDYARRGIHIEPAAREIVIHQLVLEKFKLPRLQLSVSCSKGTYIRSLVEDMGEALGCGAYVLSLDRTRCGPFDTQQSVTAGELASTRAASEGDTACLYRHLLPISSMTAGWPRFDLSKEAGNCILQGQVVPTGILNLGFVQLYADDHFLGMGEIKEPGRIAPARLIRTDKIRHSA